LVLLAHVDAVVLEARRYAGLVGAGWVHLEEEGLLRAEARDVGIELFGAKAQQALADARMSNLRPRVPGGVPPCMATRAPSECAR
jgi:hypothetical protein